MTGDRGDGSKVSQIIMEQSGGAPTQILAANDVAFDQISQRAGIDVGLPAAFSRMLSPTA